MYKDHNPSMYLQVSGYTCPYSEALLNNEGKWVLIHATKRMICKTILLNERSQSETVWSHLFKVVGNAN